MAGCGEGCMVCRNLEFQQTMAMKQLSMVGRVILIFFSTITFLGQSS
jgi:hypothetical protein